MSFGVNAQLIDFPKDVVFLIVECLSGPDTASMLQTCKRFRSFIPSEIFLKHLLIGGSWKTIARDLQEGERFVTAYKQFCKPKAGEIEQCETCYHWFDPSQPDHCCIENIGIYCFRCKTCNHQPDEICLLEPVECYKCQRTVPKAFTFLVKQNCVVCKRYRPEGLRGCKFCGPRCNSMVCPRCNERYCQGIPHVCSKIETFWGLNLKRHGDVLYRYFDELGVYMSLLIVESEHHVPQIRFTSFSGVILNCPDRKHPVLLSKSPTGLLEKKLISVDFCNCCGSNIVKLNHCSGCYKVSYCSRECQRLDWDERHKKDCRLTEIYRGRLMSLK